MCVECGVWGLQGAAYGTYKQAGRHRARHATHARGLMRGDSLWMRMHPAHRAERGTFRTVSLWNGVPERYERRRSAVPGSLARRRIRHHPPGGSTGMGHLANGCSQ